MVKNQTGENPCDACFCSATQFPRRREEMGYHHFGIQKRSNWSIINMTRRNLQKDLFIKTIRDIYMLQNDAFLSWILNWSLREINSEGENWRKLSLGRRVQRVVVLGVQQRLQGLCGEPVGAGVSAETVARRHVGACFCPYVGEGIGRKSTNMLV